MLSSLAPHRIMETVMASDLGFWLFVIISLGSIPLAGAMARERNRSSRAWFWVAVAVGPLAPLLLLLLGHARRPAAAN